MFKIANSPVEYYQAYGFSAEFLNRYGSSNEKNDMINSFVKVAPQDMVVDIGCGNGSFLARHCQQGVGIVPSEEEVKTLFEIFRKNNCFKIALSVGTATKNLLPNQYAHKVIFNNAFHCLRDFDEVIAAFKEIRRISKPGALVWVGQVPARPEEFEQYYYGNSILGFLLHTKQHRGYWTLIKEVWRLIQAVCGFNIFVISDFSYLTAYPEEVIALAKEAGLELMMSRKFNETRNDFLFKHI